MSPRFPRRSTRPQVSTRLRIIWLTRPSETPSQRARCSRGIIGWSVMRSRVRFSEGLRPKAGAASTIRSGRGIDARFRPGDSVRGPPPGAALGAHVLQRAVRAADPREVAPEAKVPSFERVPGLHGDVGVPEVQSLAELPRQSLFPHARNQD